MTGRDVRQIGNERSRDQMKRHNLIKKGPSSEDCIMTHAELFDRSAKTNGKAGDLMTDIFAATTSDTRRLREIKKTLKGLPGPCREIVPVSSTEFRSWQAAVRSHPDFGTHDD